jgi:threonylcarbamoyladenosine tRNA methylthiotransferase MtaB
VEKLRQVWPDVALTTDIIVGFPKETDEEFEETCDFVKKINFAQIHIFPFSPRIGTPAAKMSGQVAAEVKENRTKMLSQIEETLRQSFLDRMVGTQAVVLFEKTADHHAVGYTGNYLKVDVPTDTDLSNQLHRVQLIARQGDRLIGEKL